MYPALLYPISMRKRSLWMALIIPLIISAALCPAQEGRSPWITTTEEFLSELKLMRGAMNAFTPDTYYAPGGIICVVVAGEPVHCLPFGYSSANNIKDLVDKPAH